MPTRDGLRPQVKLQKSSGLEKHPLALRRRPSPTAQLQDRGPAFPASCVRSVQSREHNTGPVNVTRLSSAALPFNPHTDVAMRLGRCSAFRSVSLDAVDSSRKLISRCGRRRVLGCVCVVVACVRVRVLRLRMRSRRHVLVLKNGEPSVCVHVYICLCIQ